MKKVFKEDSEEYKLWSEIINDIYLEFDTTKDASRADDLTNKLEKLIDLISLPVEAQVKPANGDYDNMIEELRARCILMPGEQTEHKFNAGLYWAIDMIKRYKEGKGILQD